MRAPLAIGYTLLALMGASLFCLLFLINSFPEQSRDLAFNASGVTFLLCYAGLWLWMICDHFFSQSKEFVVLVAILLILGGGVAGIAYFFLVFRPRVLSQEI